MKQDENDFEKEVKQYIMQKGRVKKTQLIEDLLKKHKKDLGYSPKSIIRKLDNMKDHDIIERVPFDDYEKYGITDTNRKNCYYILKSTSKIKEHMDNVFEGLSSEEPMKQKIALKEIARYEQVYFLNPKQLDIVIAQFDKNLDNGIINDELADKLLFLLYQYILEKDIEPTDKKKTIALLVKLLDKYPVPVSTHKNLRTDIIHLLGHYGNKAVIERFMEDARTLKDLYSVESDYNTEYTAGLIEEHREELYRLEEKLAIEGKEDASQFISNVRTEALINLGLHENPYKKRKEEDYFQ